MSQYKETLNLPHTDFPMRGQLPQKEPLRLKQWQEGNLYQQVRAARKGKKSFILHDGPPYANGEIHVGHAVNKTLKDMIIKSKTLSGYDAPFVPGWDCHGLPIEHKVEQLHGKMLENPVGFRAACRDYAASQVASQKEGFQRLGVLAEWDNPYLTMDSRYEADIIRTLSAIYAKGHVQRGYKPVHWCIECGSALAEAEVEYEEKTSPSIDVGFQVLNNQAFWSNVSTSHAVDETPPVHFVIWTTTPWTLPANQAVALGDTLRYSVLKFNDAYWVVATELQEVCCARWNGAEDAREVGHFLGGAVEGVVLKHPFYAREVPVVLGAHVSTEAGTGQVHTAPAHGQEDFQLGLQYALPMDNPVGEDGCFKSSVQLFAGLSVRKANQTVIEQLESANRLLAYQKIKHSYPHCWRHKTPLIFRATQQWFISMEEKGLRQAALDAIEDVTWFPQWGENRIRSMVANRPDWCVSRQRNWCMPMTMFVHKETGELHPETEALFEVMAKKVAIDGLDAWYALSPDDVLGEEAHEYRKVTDSLDVWFDSGVSHFCVLSRREALHCPADLYLEGDDQHRGWFQSSLLTAVAQHGHAPYKQVLTHSFTVDSQGRKMSKSLGNVISPMEVAETLGVDILRLWTAATDYTSEMAVSNEILKRTTDTYRRLRNTARFLLANLHDFDPVNDAVEPGLLLSLDAWILERSRQLQEAVCAHYDAYEFHQVCQKVHHFCSMDLGSFYLDIVKDRQYTLSTNSIARRSAQTAMYHVLSALVRWLAPIISFTADEIWEYLPGVDEKSVFLSTWHEIPVAESGLSMSDWSVVIAVRDEVNKQLEVARQKKLLGSGLEAEVTLYVQDELMQLLVQLGEELRFVLITSGATLLPWSQRPEESEKSTQVTGLAVSIQVSGQPKCARCWHHCESVGQDRRAEDLCGRCVENLYGSGEERQHA